MTDQNSANNEDSSSTSGGHNVTSFNQSGGITAGELNVGSQQRKLTSENKDTLLEHLDKDDEIKVQATMGDGEAFQYAQEVKQFLEENDYESVEGVSRVVMTEPVQGQVIMTDPDDADYAIHVGSQR